jgi:O-antigen/teichoic acid export membrane protein
MLAGFASVLTRAGRSVFQAEERFGHYVRTLWIRQSALLVFVGSLFLLGILDFRLSALSILAVEIGVAALITVYIFRDFGLSQVVGVLRARSPLVSEFLRSTGWLIAYYFLLTSFQSVDVFMLSHFSSEFELANYGVAQRYYGVALLVLGSIHAVLQPRFSKADMLDPARQRQFARRWMLIGGLLLFPILLGDLLVKPLFILINGAQYERAYLVFVIFTIGVWISVTCSPLVNVLRSRKAFTFLVILAFSALVINVTGNYLLIPVFGGAGAAFITVASHAAINVTSALRVFFTNR